MPTESFTSDSSWTVPSDVSAVTLRLYGEQGENGEGDPDQSGGGGTGGNGGYLEGTLSVSEGEVLDINVGIGGGNGPTSSYGGTGGDGGGSVDVRQNGTSLSDRVAVGAGGGGGGGGDAEDGGDGGNGGAETGGTGNGVTSADPGEGGTQSSGGDGGYDGSGDGEGSDGSFLDGGDGGEDQEGGGGGGGGGWYGGGGGEGDGNGAAGGGGGSNYAGGLATVSSNQRGGSGRGFGNGLVEIQYTKPPQNLTADVVRYRSVDLSWDAVSGADDYRVYRDGVHIATTSNTSYTDESLSPTTSYSWEVTSVEGDTESDPSDSVSATTGGYAPSSVSVSVSGDDITVTWVDENGDEDGYEVHRERSSTVDTSATPVTTTASNAESFTDTALLDGERYYYRVVAVRNGERGNDSAEVDGVTALPAPTGLSADSTTADSAALSWTDNHDYGDTRVEYKQSDNASWTTFSTVSRNTEAETITGLLNGELYDARVVAETEHTSTEDV